MLEDLRLRIGDWVRWECDEFETKVGRIKKLHYNGSMIELDNVPMLYNAAHATKLTEEEAMLARLSK